MTDIFGDINWGDVEETEFDPLPRGDYKAVVHTQVTLDKELPWDKSQRAHAIDFTYTVLEGEYANRKLWSTIYANDKGFPALKTLCNTMKMDYPKSVDDFIAIANHLDSMPVGVEVWQRKGKDGKVYNGAAIIGHADDVFGKDEPNSDVLF